MLSTYADYVRSETQVTTTKPDIVFIANKDNLGDYNQAQGVLSSLNSELNVTQATQIILLDSVITARKWIDDKPHSVEIIIGIGELGAEMLQAYKAQYPNSFSKLMWVGHQYIQKLDQIIDICDTILLPNHAHIESHKIQAKCIKTCGVAHNVTSKTLKRAQDAWIQGAQSGENQAIPQSDSYLAVLLGGNAPDSQGQLHYFSVTEAQALGRYVRKLAQELKAVVLITNGPRTGNQDKEAHKGMTLPQNEPTDEVSRAFLKALDLPASQMFFNDFRYGGAPNAYLPILASVADNPKSRILVTGESTSMVSEVVDNFAPQQIILAKIASMNAVHQAHIELMSHIAKLSVIAHNEPLTANTPNVIDYVTEPHAHTTLQCEPAALQIARLIKTELTLKPVNTLRSNKI